MRRLIVCPRTAPHWLISVLLDEGEEHVAQLSSIPGFARSSAHSSIANMTGHKVTLGPLRREWLPQYQQWLNDFDMLRMVDRRFRPQSAERVSQWYERHAAGASDALVFTISANEDGRPIGNIALQDLDYRNRTAELGIYIGAPESRGNGFGTEAVHLMLEFAFRVLGLNNVMLRVYEYNEVAIHVYRKVGFREFGRRRQGQFMDGRFWDVVLMECLAGEYRRP